MHAVFIQLTANPAQKNGWTLKIMIATSSVESLSTMWKRLNSGIAACQARSLCPSSPETATAAKILLGYCLCLKNLNDWMLLCCFLKWKCWNAIFLIWSVISYLSKYILYHVKTNNKKNPKWSFPSRWRKSFLHSPTWIEWQLCLIWGKNEDESKIMLLALINILSFISPGNYSKLSNKNPDMWLKCSHITFMRCLSLWCPV